jgi:hypothetical protein
LLWNRPASKCALEHDEEKSKEAFRVTKAKLEKHLPASSNQDQQKQTMPLLNPACHLTSHTWETFHRWVKEEHEGWTAKGRDVATKEETKAAGAYDGDKSYFIDGIYDPNPKTTKPSKTNKATPEDTRDDRNPAAKKQKNVLSPPKNFVGPVEFAALPTSLHNHVLSFAGVPTIGAMTCMSKLLLGGGPAAKADSVWAPHLKFLFQELFDDTFDCSNCETQVTPISQRA